MLPYWYTLFYIYRKYGTPVIRPMFAEYPLDENSANNDKQFFVGSILVSGVFSKKQKETPIYLPVGTWYDYHTFQEIEGKNILYENSEDYIPVIIRGGSIIPRFENPKLSTKEMINNSIILLISTDSFGKAKGNFYYDDTETHDYQDGQFLMAEIEFKNYEISYKLANYLSLPNQISQIIMLGLKTLPSLIFLQQKEIQKSLNFYTKSSVIYINPLSLSISQEFTIFIR